MGWGAPANGTTPGDKTANAAPERAVSPTETARRKLGWGAPANSTMQKTGGGQAAKNVAEGKLSEAEAAKNEAEAAKEATEGEARVAKAAKEEVASPVVAVQHAEDGCNLNSPSVVLC